MTTRLPGKVAPAPQLGSAPTRPAGELGAIAAPGSASADPHRRGPGRASRAARSPTSASAVPSTRFGRSARTVMSPTSIRRSGIGPAPACSRSGDQPNGERGGTPPAFTVSSSLAQRAGMGRVPNRRPSRPRLPRIVLLSSKPERAPQFRPSFGEVGSLRHGPTQELHGVGLHVALEIGHAQPEVGVQRGPGIAGARGGARQVLDRFADDALAKADRTHGDPRQTRARAREPGPGGRPAAPRRGGCRTSSPTRAAPAPSCSSDRARAPAETALRTQPSRPQPARSSRARRAIDAPRWSWRTEAPAT